MRLSTMAAVLVLLCIVQAAFAGKKSEQPASTLNFLVVRDADGKPVRNAEVVLHSVGKDGKQKDESIELKTHEDGTTTIGGIARGKVRIQVIAPGFRTWGQDFDIDQPQHDITIKLQKPSDQFSIYK